MTTTGRTWIIVGLLLLATGATLAWQRQQSQRLQAEREARRVRADEIALLETNVARLRTNQITETEVTALREDRASLERLRVEIEELKTAGDTARPAASPRTVSEEMKPLAAHEWKHAGRVTPAATLETLLWARLHGNVDVIASGLAFENDAARELALTLMASLPPTAGAHRDSPERLIALLAAADTDYGSYDSMQIVEEMKPGEKILESVRQRQPDVTDVVILRSQLRTKTGENQNKALFMQRNYDGWKLIVPAAVVETYAGKLKANAR